MFNIGITEIILLLLIAFIVVGPEDLPRIARALGRFVRYLRKMLQEIKRETGFDEVTSEIRDVDREIRKEMKDLDIRDDLKQARSDVEKELKTVKDEVNLKGIEEDLKQTQSEIKDGLQSVGRAMDLDGIKKEMSRADIGVSGDAEADHTNKQNMDERQEEGST